MFGKGGVVDKAVARGYSTALWMYDLAGGWRIGRRHRRITADEISSHFPTLRTDSLVAGFLYYDARTDDARLTLAILRTAVLEHGAVAANYVPAVGFVHDERGHVAGVRVAPVDEPRSGAWLAQPQPSPTEQTVDAFEIRAKVVVNATGVWADELRRLDDPAFRTSLRPAKGIHLTVPNDKLPCDLAAVLPVPKDRRSIFVIPWDEHTYLGTTDTDYDGPLDDPQVEPEDVAYVLGAVNAAVSKPLTPEDVTANVGRPSPAARRDRRTRPRTQRPNVRPFRRHQVQRSASGLISITGGKLTTYRKMAADTVDAVQRELGSAPGPCLTKHLRLRGSEGVSALGARDLAKELASSPRCWTGSSVVTAEKPRRCSGSSSTGRAFAPGSS